MESLHKEVISSKNSGCKLQNQLDLALVKKKVRLCNNIGESHEKIIIEMSGNVNRKSIRHSTFCLYSSLNISVLSSLRIFFLASHSM